jgi:hypothetical protein
MPPSKKILLPVLSPMGPVAISPSVAAPPLRRPPNSNKSGSRSRPWKSTPRHGGTEFQGPPVTARIGDSAPAKPTRSTRRVTARPSWRRPEYARAHSSGCDLRRYARRAARLSFTRIKCRQVPPVGILVLFVRLGGRIGADARARGRCSVSSRCPRWVASGPSPTGEPGYARYGRGAVAIRLRLPEATVWWPGSGPGFRIGSPG